MKSKARKRQDWTYHHTEEIIALNNEILARQEREEGEAAATAAATANVAATAAQPLGINPLDQVE